MNRFLMLALLTVVSLRGVALGDETEEYNKIRGLLGAGKTAEAEKVFGEALKEYPDSDRLKSLNYLFYAYNNRDENYAAAAKYLETFIDGMLPAEGRPSGYLSQLPRFTEMLTEVYGKGGREDEIAEKLDAILAKVEKAAESGDASAKIAARELRNQQFLRLAEQGDVEAARKMLEERLAAARKAVDAAPTDEAAQLDLLFLVKGQVELAEATGADNAEKLRETYLSTLMSKAIERKDVPVIVTAVLDEAVQTIAGMARKQPFKAEQGLKNLQEFAASLETDDPQLKSRIATLKRSAASLQRSIDVAKAHAELIGKEAFPLTAEAWVNGTPLTPADLEGKVVLLDFWAVWCGPCIATFPHLRQWREEYADKGLVIIGVTRYYQYGWNEEMHRAQREEGISQADERKAMEKFAEHYNLQHRFMITPPDSKLQESYRVSGIPQAVLIDRAGKIRLIRVGSGESNAHDIEKMLAELIGDTE